MQAFDRTFQLHPLLCLTRSVPVLCATEQKVFRAEGTKKVADFALNMDDIYKVPVKHVDQDVVTRGGDTVELHEGDEPWAALMIPHGGGNTQRDNGFIKPHTRRIPRNIPKGRNGQCRHTRRAH